MAASHKLNQILCGFAAFETFLIGKFVSVRDGTFRVQFAAPRPFYRVISK